MLMTFLCASAIALPEKWGKIFFSEKGMGVVGSHILHPSPCDCNNVVVPYNPLSYILPDFFSHFVALFLGGAKER